MTFSCLQPELRPVLSWQRTVKKCHLPGVTGSRSQPGAAGASREHHRSCREKQPNPQIRFSIYPVQESPRKRNWGPSDLVLCFKQRKLQNYKEGSGEIGEFCLIFIQNLPATGVTPNLTQVHQELTWLPVALAMFCTALQESQLNPEGILCEAQGIKLLHSAFFMPIPKNLPNRGINEYWKHFNYLMAHT